MTDNKKINPLFKSSVLYLIATIIGQGMSCVGIIVFTRLMNQEEYGLYSTYYAYVSIFTVLIGANLYYSLNNAYIDLKDEIKEFRKSVMVLSMFIMMGILLLTLFVASFIFKKASPFVVIMAMLHSYGFFIISYRVYSANMENDYKKKLWLLILPYFFQFLFAWVFIFFFPEISFIQRVIGSTVGICSVAIVFSMDVLFCPGKVINRAYWKYALSIALPTTIMSISFMLMQQCDKVMITNICGAQDTAVYSVIYYLGYAMIAVDQAFAPVRQAWIFNRLSERNVKDVPDVQKWYLVIMALLATGLIFAGPEIVKIISPEAYWRFEYIVPFVLSACMMILYRFFTEVLLFYKKNMLLSGCVLLCAVINIGLNALLIPVFGAVAACYTTVIAYGLLFLLTWFFSIGQSGKVYEWKFFVLYFVWVVFMSGVYMFTGGNSFIRYGMILVTIILILTYMKANKAALKEMLSERKKNE